MNGFPPSSRGRPGVGLESWLVKTLERGVLRNFPLFYPLLGTEGQRPEPYARRLLAELRDPDLSAWDRAQVLDDGRAFRGWAEAPRASSPSPAVHRAGNPRLSPCPGG